MKLSELNDVNKKILLLYLWHFLKDGKQNGS